MSHRKWGAGLVIACALVPALAPAPAPAQTSRDVKVMTRNVYVGADLIPLATQPNPQAFETAASGVYQVLLANDFAKRAKLLAAEVRKHKPDLIGVQEAARWLRGPKDGAATEASEVIYDSETELLKAFRAAGQNYKVVEARDWFEFEGPTADGFDARIIQRDLILVRAGSKVKTGKTFSGGFRDTFDPPTPIGVARQLRGWVGVDAKVGGRSFRFVTTHLEAYDPAIGDKQMAQLLAGPLKSKKRTSILLGDFNSAPTGNANDRGTSRSANAYHRAIRAGFRNPLPKRDTCCFAEDLRQTSKGLESWIDHIVVRPNAKVVRSAIVGSKSSERGSGLWPSDHAGIAATLRLK